MGWLKLLPPHIKTGMTRLDDVHNFVTHENQKLLSYDRPLLILRNIEIQLCFIVKSGRCTKIPAAVSDLEVEKIVTVFFFFQ